jgi:hypothetical protein
LVIQGIFLYLGFMVCEKAQRGARPVSIKSQLRLRQTFGALFGLRCNRRGLFSLVCLDFWAINMCLRQM